MGWLTKLTNFFRSFFYIIFVNYPSFFVYSLLCVFFKTKDTSGSKSRDIILSFLKRHAKFFRLKIKTIGLDRIHNNENYLVIANFNSVTDIIVLLLSYHNNRIVPIIRSHNFFIPFFGWALKSADYIPFSNKKPIKSLKKVVSAIKNKNLSVIHFPAGYNTQVSAPEKIPLNYLKIAKNAESKLLPVKIIEYDRDNGAEYKVIYNKPIDITAYKNINEANNIIFDLLFK